MAQIVPGASEQQLQNLLTDMVWDEHELNEQRIAQMLTLPTEGDAVIILDDTGFPKQGKRSAGVQRQYSGTLGKTGNCQVAVTCHYAERTIAWPVDARLYLPESWATDEEACRRSRVPEAVEFRTQPEIALSLLDEARKRGVPHRCVTVDADYGDKPPFLNALDERGEHYVVAVAPSFSVAVSRNAPSAAEISGGATTGATSPLGCRAIGWWSTRTAGGGSRNTTRKRSSSWAGMISRAGDTTRSTDTRWP